MAITDIFGNTFTTTPVANNLIEVYMNGEYYTRCSQTRWADCLTIDGITELPYIY